jgi:predicted transposase/invertase (TIGR01784 family)
MKNPDKIHRFYDKTYKKLFSYERIVSDFTKAFVKEPFARQLEFIELVNTEYISKRYRKYFSDLVWKARYKGKEVFIFVLFEFTMKSDDNLILRILNYMILFYLSLLKGNEYKMPLPPVFPIVIYTGIDEFKAKTNFNEVIQKPSEGIVKYIPDFSYYLFDLTKLPKNILNRLSVHSKNLTALLFEIEKIDKTEFEQELNSIKKLLNENVPEDLKEEFTEFIINSVAENERETQKITEIINKNTGGTMFYETAREWKKMMRDEGRIEGKLEGKLEGEMKGKIEGKMEGKMEVAKNLLKNKVDIHTISKSTELPLKKIKQLQKEIA